MRDCAHEAEGPDGEAENKARGWSGTEASEVAAKGDCVEEVEYPGSEKDDGMDGGHGGVKEGREKRAVDVVCYLSEVSGLGNWE